MKLKMNFKKLVSSSWRKTDGSSSSLCIGYWITNYRCTNSRFTRHVFSSFSAYIFGQLSGVSCPNAIQCIRGSLHAACHPIFYSCICFYDDRRCCKTDNPIFDCLCWSPAWWIGNRGSFCMYVICSAFWIVTRNGCSDRHNRNWRYDTGWILKRVCSGSYM